MKNIFIPSAIAIRNSFNRIISFSLSLCFISIAFFCFAQTPNTWTQKADFGGGLRYHAIGFSIGSKGYIGTGLDPFSKSFWEWDQSTDTWSQKADFGGTATQAPVGFSIGSKGYVGTGYDEVVGYKKDFWEWDQATNIWTRKTDFGGTARAFSIGFSIGTKGYIGTGSATDGYKNDFWEWDQATDMWTQKTDFGGTGRYGATGFSIGTLGYIGTGDDAGGSGRKKDFWEYNPSLNIWSQKADFGGGIRVFPVGFSIGNKGYIGTGSEEPGSPGTKDFWEWDQNTNIWTAKVEFSGAGRHVAVGFSVGTKGYIGTGNDAVTGGNAGTFQDFWEYTSGAEACPGILVTNAGPDKTVYYGYLPEQCTTLIGSSMDGTPPYQYLWSTGATTASISVCPIDSTAYTLTVTDANGCSNSDQVSVKVIDVHCNDKGKVILCHNPGPNQVTICVSPNAVESQLANGDLLGTCGIARRLNLDTTETEKPMTIYPNPSTGLFSVEVCKNKIVKDAKIEVENSLGQIVYSKTSFKTQGCIKEIIELNHDLPEGMYFLNLIIGGKSEIRKLILTNK